MSDPVEDVVATALDRAGFAYVREADNPSGLDFGLACGVQIEVKRFHSPRIAGQMARAPDVIAIQGMKAARTFAAMIEGRVGEKV